MYPAEQIVIIDTENKAAVGMHGHQKYEEVYSLSGAAIGWSMESEHTSVRGSILEARILYTFMRIILSITAPMIHSSSRP